MALSFVLHRHRWPQGTTQEHVVLASIEDNALDVDKAYKRACGFAKRYHVKCDHYVTYDVAMVTNHATSCEKCKWLLDSMWMLGQEFEQITETE